MLHISRLRGFTLVELMVVLVLVSITAAIAAPNFGLLIRNNQLQSSAEEFSDFLNFARSQAVINRSAYDIEFTAGDDTWSVKRKATGEIERSLEINPATTSLIAFDSGGSSITKISYSSTGSSGKETFITICTDNDPATGYRIQIQPSGKLNLSLRGKKDSKPSSPALTSCTAP